MSDSSIISYGGSETTIVGPMLIPVSQGNVRCTLNWNTIDAPTAHSLLSGGVCIGMGLVRILDCDAQQRTDTNGTTVHAVRRSSALTMA